MWGPKVNQMNLSSDFVPGVDKPGYWYIRAADGILVS